MEVLKERKMAERNIGRKYDVHRFHLFSFLPFSFHLMLPSGCQYQPLSHLENSEFGFRIARSNFGELQGWHTAA